ncbi:transcription termination/antitermination NusG family protein, partial [Pseudomonas fragi]
ESLFPGYLFIHMPPGANWAPLRSTRGVARVVAFGG